MMNVLAFADDATGALEVGARWAGEGARARVSFAGLMEARALVLDTETRHLAPAEARARVRGLAAAARAAHIFKKTDSTLRGPIAAEFAALLEVWPERALVYAPAYPALGRTVVDGELYVHRRKLAETAFAADPLNPARESRIAAVLADCGAPVRVVRHAGELEHELAAGRVLVCDGTADEDLETVAAVLARSAVPAIAAGPAALAQPWIRALGEPRGGPMPHLRASTGLVVSGSLHPASREQVASSGMPAVAQDAAEVEEELAGALAHCGWAVLAAVEPLRADPLAVAAHAARVARWALERARPDALVVFGGDTTIALLRELGVASAEPCREILPGVPLATIRALGREMALVTKAGGFGDARALAAIRAILTT